MFYVLVFCVLVILLALLVRLVDERRHPLAPAPVMPPVLNRRPADYRPVSGDAGDWLDMGDTSTVSDVHCDAMTPALSDCCDAGDATS